MSQLLFLKKRLKSIQNINKVTKAMETMAITSLKRLQKQQKINSGYARKLEEVMRCFLQSLNNQRAVPEGKSPGNLYVVFFSTRSFCGNFNSALLNFFQSKYSALRDPGDQLLFVGRLGRKQLRYYPTARISNPDYSEIKELCWLAVQENRQVFLVYNKYISLLRQDPTWLKLFPLENEPTAESPMLFYEPGKETIKKNILPLYIKLLLEEKANETLLGEYSNRFVSMHGANENSKTLIEALKIDLNKMRQSSITMELSEVVSAFEVMLKVKK